MKSKSIHIQSCWKEGDTITANIAVKIDGKLIFKHVEFCNGKSNIFDDIEPGVNGPHFDNAYFDFVANNTSELIRLAENLL